MEGHRVLSKIFGPEGPNNGGGVEKTIQREAL